MTTTMEQTTTARAWDAIAAGYDQHVTPTGSRQVAETALDVAGLRGDERLLDVACGTGALALAAARRGADVLGVDFAPAMIEHFEARARAEGLANVAGRVMDAHHLDLADGVFDVTASQFGVMLVPDQPRALREMVRVTRPGGTILVVGYRPPPEVEFLGFFVAAVQAVVPAFTPPPPDQPMLPFQAADPGVLRRRLEDAGATGVEITSAVEHLRYDSGAQLWDWLLNSNPISEALTSDLSDTQRADVREVLDGMLRERAAGARTATITAGVNIAVGTT
jgi:ubiquinone/menaquinone biosynthesis C-methylase UbiE